MSAKEHEGPYVYQPYGSIGNVNPFDPRRMYGVGGVVGATITGLTKAEAEAIVKILKAFSAPQAGEGRAAE